jgi:alpha-N-acetylglucosaminidase
MALNGINLPLAFNGQEFIWQKLFREFGVDQDGLDEFFTGRSSLTICLSHLRGVFSDIYWKGPAYLPWQRMGNLNQWRGSLTSEWIQADHDLQMLILKRQREFGMTPVLPAFAGHVPGALKDLFPTSKISQLEKWAGFPGTYYLVRRDWI